MDFKTFCKETSKVEIVIDGKNMSASDSLNGLISNDMLIPVQGFYFPNDKEIANICNYFKENIFYSMHMKYLPGAEEVFCSNFMKKLSEEINMNLEKDQFIAIESFLRREKEEVFTSIGLKMLTEIIGQTYEKLGILNQDIRLNALATNPKINLIGQFEKAEVGYQGLAYILNGIEK
jgi:hypothetical protein